MQKHFSPGKLTSQQQKQSFESQLGVREKIHQREREHAGVAAQHTHITSTNQQQSM
jgi:hypothetical protein